MVNTNFTPQALLAFYAAAQQELEAMQAFWAEQEAGLMAQIPQEIRKNLEEISATRAARQEEYRATIALLASQIKTAVLSCLHSAKWSGYLAVFSPGRVSWDDAFLQGYAATHEEILQGRKEGPPSVSIRKEKA